ncbi:SigB/SigF/SigG family RNA polymerase sigma factor [Solirubrobacter ginsenosidimutans]|uniref:SigB/SigF/SigG family RNA polymerase sigma factor n=1 Tax=Solirubrobacter ginsenosidimutans TaxID=490573 RepID=A0A9X3N2E6_9ACTN|nr:SigB/SigF/SigG family RNA polymerase sigma factor [Solirubrobacter ginsenosidimutans]MDA0167259.1 SigB/SigF/SigG family RNA polymerase sigma factor [Solirubrobacter ginsenosidimutans]
MPPVDENRWTATRAHWHAARRAHERRLFARLTVDRSPAARAAIVEQFMPLARQLARRYGNVEDIDDLEQVAAIGLVKAIDRFDPDRGLAFSSFAFPTILGELKRHLRDRGWSVRPPRDVQELAARAEQHAHALLAELGRSPTVSQIAERAGSTVEQVLEAMQATNARHAVSLDEPIRDTDPSSRAREVAVEEAGFAAAENAMLLDAMLRQLTERERRVLDLRFRRDLTQSRVAEIVGISQMHVSRMLRTSLAKLQAAAEQDPTAPTTSPRHP